MDQEAKRSEIHLNPLLQKSLFPEQQNYFITGKVQPGTMPKAVPKPCANNHALTASKTPLIGKQRNRAEQCGLQLETSALPQARPAPGSPCVRNTPSSSLLPSICCCGPFTFYPALGPFCRAQPWEPTLLCTPVRASETSPGFNTESHKCFSFVELAFSQESKFWRTFSSQLERNTVPASTCTAWVFPGGLDQTRHKRKPASTLAGR